MKPITVFTLRDLNISGGGAIRIKSLLDILKEQRSLDVYSNTDMLSEFNHSKVGVHFNNIEKRLLQFLLSFFPAWVAGLVFKVKLKKIEQFFKLNINPNVDILFCEYLDTSLGYYLKRRGLINQYINDTHGISTLELKYKNFKYPIVKSIALMIAHQHDRKVFSAASSFIFVSSAMKDYFFKTYVAFKNKSFFIVPNVANSSSLSANYDNLFLEKVIQKYNLDLAKPIIFFAGGYKDLGGVHDLITVFSRVRLIVPNIQLVLIGDGFNQDSVDGLISKLNIVESVFQLGRQPYEKLYTLQQMASVIVCPDKENDYSNLIVHLKYFDSVASNRPVVCAGFDSVKEINKQGNFARLYPPSDLVAMENEILFCLNNQKEVLKDCEQNRKVMANKLTYNNFKDEIVGITS